MTKRNVALICFVALKFFLHYWLVNPEYELHRDEYLHLDQADHLAWGFLSVPPATSWFSWIIQALGNSIFWVRFFPGLFGALTMYVVWRAVEELGGGLYACVLAAVAITFSVLMRLNILWQPNSLDVLCWTACYYGLIRYFNTERPAWLYITAALFAFGFLNKYNILFLAMGFVPAIVISKQRKILAVPHVYGAALFALVLVLPNLMWQLSNGFPVIHHMNELARTQLVNVDLGDFLRSQVLYFSGSLFLILAGFYALGFHERFSRYRPFLWSFWFTMAIFILLKAKSYYTIGLYPIYIAFGAAYLSRLLDTRSTLGSIARTLLQVLAVALPLLSFIPVYKVAFPNKTPEYIVAHPEWYKALGLLRWEDGKDHAVPQDFADMLGWKEMAQKTERALVSIPAAESALVLTGNYGQAGAINYYSGKRVNAVSFSADYVDWFTFDKSYKNLIYVVESPYVGDVVNEYAGKFETWSVTDSVRNEFAREKGTSIVVFKNAKVDINGVMQRKIAAIKKEWGGE